MKMRSMVLAASLLGVGGLVVSATGAGAAGNQLVHVQFFTTADAGSGPGPIMLSGAISDTTCVDTQGANIDSVQCADGSFMVDHSAPAVSESFQMVGCTGIFKFLAPYTVFDGTGRFAGISGSGLASGVSTQTAASVNGVCDFNAPPVSGSTMIWTSFIASFS